MFQNFTERRSRLGHGSRSRLAQADAVTLTTSFEDDELRAAVSGEVIAGYRIPTETAIQGQPGSLSAFRKSPASAGETRRTQSEGWRWQ